MAAVDRPIRVAILTTRSVVTIQRIEPETRSSRSVMCINRTSVETGVSRAYNQFVSHDTGVVSKMTGVAVFRTDVDGEVTDGRSWELPIFLAHVLRRDRRLAGAAAGDRAEALWIATGEVDADHQVKRVEGIAQKLKVLEEWLATAPADRPPVRLLLPSGNRADAANLLQELEERNVAVQFLDHAEELFAAPTPVPAIPPTPAPTPAATREPTPTLTSTPAPQPSLLPKIALAAVVLIGLIGAWMFLRPSTPGPVSPGPDAPRTAISGFDVVVREVRSTDKCYGGERQQADHHVKIGEEIRLPAAGRLCRLEAVATNAGNPQHAYLIGRNGQALTPMDLGLNGSLTSKLITEDTVLEVAFSPQPLEATGDISTLPRIVIRIEQKDRPARSG